MSGTLFVVATPIGNLEDISGRALRVLREVALIAAEDTRRTAHLLARHAIKTPTTSLHEHNELSKAPSLLERLRRGDDIALVSDAGTPTVSDPGQRLIRSASELGIRIEPVPGPSAILAALSVSGLPASTFTFLGFPPTRSLDRKQWFDQLRRAGRTVVFFEAPHRIRRTLEELKLILGDQAVVVTRELTKKHEELVIGPISDVLKRLETPRGEYTIVVEIGHSTENRLPERPPDRELYTEFGYITDIVGSTRRAAISHLARKYGAPSKEIYSAVERQRKLVKQQNIENA